MNDLFSYLGWAFLPQLATNFLQSLFYSLTIRAGDPKPSPGSPKHEKHRRRIQIVVISLYLAFTIFEADWNLRRDGDFYQALGVDHDADDKALKSKFRRLAAQYHPDKISSAEARENAEAYFVHLKLASDTLLSPVKRFAYDRFGPDILGWRQCSSFQDYVLRGFQLLAPYYIGGALFLFTLSVLGYLDGGSYWRYLSTFSLFTFEAYTISRPYFPPISSKLINPFLRTFTSHPPLLPFQQLILARKTGIAIIIALARIGPLLRTPEERAAPNSETALLLQVDRLEKISKTTEIEAMRLLALDMAPFAGDEETIKGVKTQLQNWLVENTIRSDKEVRDAVGRVVGKRRTDAPHGARGTM
ncbi:hypothetical protein GP486_001728 [Trichoglossum hirsutum]|uniref:J domain-containing protein n=1 Tax=Trichoglossum hirsutum TaxID=265104 RepID=A0A9P8LGK9_9PEZI|nr:hypothetical protein GP486_001728 [Trichoglossum hirsutum]